MKIQINKKKDILYMGILAMVVLGVSVALFYIVESKGNVYGSDADWLSQHYTIAEYIRSNFYESKNLFPDFTMNLGAGQSFSQFIYYGLLRPEMFVSFLLPFLSMKQYLAMSSIFLLLMSVELMYYWLKKEGISSQCAWLSSILFACSGPLLFHTHRHIMFMNYMPWLILSFIGIRRYLLKNKSDVMITGVVLMVMASYFFSVSGVIMCGVYAIYGVIRYIKPRTFQTFAYTVCKCCLHVGFALGMVAILLVPTAFSMLADHRDGLQAPTLLQLLKPDGDMSAFLVYTSGAYTIGLTAIAIVAVLYSLYVKKLEYRVVGGIVLLMAVVPIFRYVLNGMQYIREKSLIPMLPLVILLIAYMIENIPKKKEISFLFWMPLVFLPIFFMTGTSRRLYVLDVCIIIVVLTMLIVKRWKAVLFLYLIVPTYFLVKVNKEETFVKGKNWNIYNDVEKKKMISDTLNKDTGFYRFDDQDYPTRTVNQVIDSRMNKTTSYSSNFNVAYNNYFYQLMRMASLNPTNTNMLTSQNPFFQGMMGVKYMFTKDSVPYGYKTIEKNGDKKIIENPNVFPIAYATSQLMSEHEFQKIQYPYSIDTIYNRSIVDSATTSPYTSQFKETKLNYNVKSSDPSLQIAKTTKGYRIKATKKSKLVLTLDTAIKDQILLVRLPIRDVKNGANVDTKIAINGIQETLSKSGYLYKNDRFDFDYFLSRNTQWDTMTFEFSKGEYTIQDPKVYSMDGSVLHQRIKNIDKMDVQKKEGTILSGSIQVQKNGYFITSIPYQNGFRITVDGKDTAYEKVNTAFVGFPIDKGGHTIEISFETPGKKIGLSVSVVCVGIGILLFFKKHIQRKWFTQSKRLKNNHHL